MLTNALKIQMHGYLQHLRHDISLESSLSTDEKSMDLHRLLDEIASLSPKIMHEETNNVARRPSFSIKRRGKKDVAVSFAGLPLGHEFDSLVLALLQVGGHPGKLTEEQVAQIKAINEPLNFETYFSVSCHACPDVVQMLNTMSILNPLITHTAIDGSLFPQEVDARDIRSVPHVFLNGETFSVGQITLERILKKLDRESYSEEAVAQRLSKQDPYDILVVGAGPAGIAAAVYAARKGLRIAIISENFGGQVQETVGIENFISVPETIGHTLVQNMGQHLARYHVEILSDQKVKSLIPAKQGDIFHEIILSNGAALKAKTVIAASGARWRRLGIPGEEEYRSRGVAYCAHCDGPFYHGRNVAVVGGGNSAAEAAIDLASHATHVTLFHRRETLDAEYLLQERLKKITNLTIIPHSEVQKILGDNNKMTGLIWKNKNSGEEQKIAMDGIFVQIGLQANVEWLDGALPLSPQGEVVVDQAGKTSIPGIFAAGDLTIVPYKQIIVAMGEGAKAALSAFDYLVRLPS